MTFSGRFLLSIIHYASLQGANRKTLLQLTGLDEDALCAEDTRVEAHSYNALLNAAIEQTGDPLLGLHFGESLNLSAAGLISQISQTSRTVQEALEYCCHFASLGCRALPLELTELEDAFCLSLIPDPAWALDSEQSVHHTIDGFMVFTLREFEELTRHTAFPLAIHLKRKQVTNPKEYLRIFKVPLQLGQQSAAIYFSKEHIRRPVVTSDYSLLRVLVAHAEEKLAQIQQQAGFFNVVKHSIIHLVKPEFPNIEMVAANLNMSVRSLQRRLKEEGHTFQNILDNLRNDFAISYLKNPALSINEIAYLLSYSDTSAFIRSFKRRNEITPNAYRKQEN